MSLEDIERILKNIKTLHGLNCPSENFYLISNITSVLEHVSCISMVDDNVGRGDGFILCFLHNYPHPLKITDSDKGILTCLQKRNPNL